MVLLYRESIASPRIVLLRTPCCARIHSIAFDLITSKAELFTSGLRTSMTLARYANSTNQSSKHGWDYDIQGLHTCATRYFVQDLARDFKTSEFRRNCWATYEEDRFIAVGNRTHLICIKTSQQCFLHVIPHNCSEMHRIVAILIIAHSLLHLLETDFCLKDTLFASLWQFRGLSKKSILCHYCITLNFVIYFASIYSIYSYRYKQMSDNCATSHDEVPGYTLSKTYNKFPLVICRSNSDYYMT